MSSKSEDQVSSIELIIDYWFPNFFAGEENLIKQHFNFFLFNHSFLKNIQL